MIHIKGHNTQFTMQIPGKQVSSLPYKLMTLIQLLITRGISSPVACTPQRENRFKLLVEHLNTNANNHIILVLLSNSKKSIKNVSCHNLLPKTNWCEGIHASLCSKSYTYDFKGCGEGGWVRRVNTHVCIGIHLHVLATKLSEMATAGNSYSLQNFKHKFSGILVYAMSEVFASIGYDPLLHPQPLTSDKSS